MIIALDLGTTGNRAIVFDNKGTPVASAYRTFPQYFPQPGWVEHDPMEIWESVQEVMREALSHGHPVAGIGITNQRETIVVWDKETGLPIYNAIVWQCRRTADECQKLKPHYGQLIHEKTGLWLDPYFSATKLRWILDKVPGAREKARQKKILCGTIDSWIIWKLTEGQIHATDPSNASRTLLYDLSENRFSPFLTTLFDIPQHLLPEIRPSNATFGEWQGIPICGVLGDQQAALLAQSSGKPTSLKNTYGTGLFLMATLPAERTALVPQDLIKTVAWTCGTQTEYAIEGSVFTGGSLIQWLRDGLGLLSTSTESESLASSVTDTGDVYCVPGLTGLGAPYWDPYARGLLIGMTRGTTKAHVVRAALESLAYQTRDMVHAVSPMLGTSPTALQVDGGASANNWLMQYQADILGIPVDRPKVLETTALGAAGMAGVGLGYWQLRDIGQLRQSDHVFEPQMSLSERDERYARWQQAVSRSLHWAPTSTEQSQYQVSKNTGEIR